MTSQINQIILNIRLTSPYNPSICKYQYTHTPPKRLRETFVAQLELIRTRMNFKEIHRRRASQLKSRNRRFSWVYCSLRYKRYNFVFIPLISNFIWQNIQMRDCSNKSNELFYLNTVSMIGIKVFSNCSVPRESLSNPKCIPVINIKPKRFFRRIDPIFYAKLKPKKSVSFEQFKMKKLPFIIYLSGISVV